MKFNGVYTVGYSGYHQDALANMTNTLKSRGCGIHGMSIGDLRNKFPVDWDKAMKDAVASFAGDLKAHEIDVVADVRTNPYSKFSPEFDRENLSQALKACGLKYLFMGDELGARPSDRGCYVNGAVDYDKVQDADFFKKGLDRVQTGLGKGFTIALLCAEKDPIDCHRNILVARALSKRGVQVRHLVQLAANEPAVAEEMEDTESRLFEECDMGSIAQGDLFMSPGERVEIAYRRRFEKIAYREEEKDGNE